MTTNLPPKAESKGTSDLAVAGTSNLAGQFADMAPSSVDVISIMSANRRDALWGLIYRTIPGFSAADEAAKLSVRCGVYTYLAVNGTSSKGEYTGGFKSSKGAIVSGADIVKVVGQLDMRRFMRGNAVESLEFFRRTNVLATRDDVRARCEFYGIRAEDSIALCDWLDMAVGLTPKEREAQLAIKNYGITRARAARGGKTVEGLRDERLEHSVDAQGPIMQPSSDGW